jgi:hypothetical protein
MSNGITPYNAQPKAVQRVYAEIERRADTSREVINTQAQLTNYAMYQVAMLKRNQTALELIAPEASDALNLIATTGAMNIARQVNDFGSRF